MNITALAIANNRSAFLLFFVILLSGIAAYGGMPKDYDPGFILRTAQVVTQFPGASPERVEQLVTDKLEKVVHEMPELDFVSSESRTGVSIISVNIKESYKQMRPIWDSLRRKIESAADQLPDEAGSPVVNDEFGDVYGIVVGLETEGYSQRESRDIAEQIRDELLRLPDVAKIEIFGAQEERIFVDYNNDRLAELGLSPAQLGDQLSSRNIVIPGGTINIGRERISLEPSGNFESLRDIRQTIIQVPGSDNLIYLGDFTDVYHGYEDPPKSRVRIDGRPALALAISMRAGGNNISLGEQVLAEIGRLEQVYPIGVELSLVSFLPSEVEEKVDDFVSNLLQAVVVVTLVMLVFLGLRTGLIVASLIPSSMIFCILVMSFFDIGIDQISLAALIIALGMLVDNGIVMSENIMVQMSRGKAALDAAIDSANELKVPLLTSSLTTAAAFLPIFLAESTTGEYTASLFKVVTITLLCSWLISVTIIPMLCLYFMRVRPSAEAQDSAWYRHYRRLLAGLLRFRWVTLGATLAILVLALNGFGLIPKLFFPPSDRGYFKLELEMPVGTRIEATGEIAREIEAFLAAELAADPGSDRPGVTGWTTYLGNGGPRFLLTHSPKPSSPYYAFMLIQVSGAEIIDSIMQRIDRFTFERFPDLLVKLRKIENGAPITNPVEVRISGHDRRQLFEIVDRVKREMASLGGLRAVSDNWGLPIKKLKVDIAQDRARRAGVSSQDIAVSLQTGLSGMELSEFRDGVDVIPISLRSTAADRDDLRKLEALAVFSQASGSSVPLKQVADISVAWEPANILRRDRLKTVTVGAQLEPGATAAEAFGRLSSWIEQEQATWPVGFRYEFGGEAESSGKANQSIAEKLPIAVGIILLLLVGQFNSIRKAAIILATIPLGLIGVFVGLFLGQSFFGFMTLLGIISLAGIVINNAIVLLERIKIESEATPDDLHDAIIRAAQHRLRPILLTTATTVLGLIPLYLGGGEMWEPMALAIMGGLLVSTLLTLGIVPVLYAVLYRIPCPVASGSPGADDGPIPVSSKSNR